MPIVATEKDVPTDVLKYDIPPYSRDEIVVVSGAGVVRNGAVLGRITASGKFTPWAPAASNGSEVVAGVHLGTVDATSADRKSVAVRRHAIVAQQPLVFADGVTSNEKATAVAALIALGIVVRQGA